MCESDGGDGVFVCGGYGGEAPAGLRGLMNAVFAAGC